MGFNGKTPPRPEGPKPTNKIGKEHKHTWWKNGKKKQTTCTCDTGKDHVTENGTT